MKQMDNFLEYATVAEANTVDLNLYTYLDGISAKRSTWCFKIRAKKKA